MTYPMNLLFALLVLASPLFTCAAYISFNTTTAEWCTVASGGCSFLNSSIWINETVPSTNDDVNITSATSPILIYLPSSNNATYTLSSLYVDQAQFFISSYSILNITSYLSVSSGLFSVSGSLVAPAGSLLSFSGNLDINGSLVAYGDTAFESTTITVAPTAFVSLYNVSYNVDSFNSQANISITNLTIPSGITTSLNLAQLQVQNVTIEFNSTVSFEEEFDLPQIHVALGSYLLIDASGSIGSNTSSLSGNGTVIVTNANLTILSESPDPLVFFGDFIANGTSILYIQQLQVYNFITGAGVIVHGDGLVLAGSATTLAGSWVALAGGINITGWADIVGSIKVLSRLVIAPSGSLVLTNQLSLANNATILFGGYLLGNVNVLPSTTFEVFDGSNATINGFLVNNGSLILHGDHPLHVYGDVTFVAEGNVQATLTDEKTPILVVSNGNLTLAGPLAYSIIKKPFLKSSKYLFAEIANGANTTFAINGAFNGTATALKGSQIDRDLNLEYQPASVYIVYGFQVHDVPVWVWIVFSLVVLALVAGIITVALKCRTRKGYQPVP